jgi:hypothetical protein
MRTISLIPTEFVEFVRIANEVRLWFTYTFLHGVYNVEADSELLENLGY